MPEIISSLSEALDLLNLEKNNTLLKVEKEYPFLISEYYLNLIDRKEPLADPVFLQSFPSENELSEHPHITEDPQCENNYSPLPKLVHRYKDRALILSTGRCFSYCRFCFRKRRWKSSADEHDISEKELSDIISYIREHPSIEEIILSGGDSLALSDKKLNSILDALYALKNIRTIRLASRSPVTFPSRITDSLVKIISKYPSIWFLTHFNHPNELTSESIGACRKITSSGIPILNQTVLLKGVNDSSDTLRKLFRELTANRIKPYYLFHVDPVKGVTHFATGIDKGLEIIRNLRKELSSIATPLFAIDLPAGGGKVHLQPSYSPDNKLFLSTEEDRLIRYY